MMVSRSPWPPGLLIVGIILVAFLDHEGKGSLRGAEGPQGRVIREVVGVGT